MDESEKAAKIKKYLITEVRVPAGEVLDLCEKITKYEDILSEFLIWLESGAKENARSYPENGTKINGYTAKRIYELQPRLTGAGVYGILADLRDKPERMTDFIREGLPIE